MTQSKIEQSSRSLVTSKEKKTIGWLAVGGFLLPLLGWSIGALANPHGWMSDISMFILFFLMPFQLLVTAPGQGVDSLGVPGVVAVLYSGLMLIFIITLIIAFFKKRTTTPLRIVSRGWFVVSFLWSLLILNMVATAKEEEFTS